MFRRFPFIVSIFISLFILTGCVMINTTNQNEVIVPSTTKVIDSETSNKISRISEDSIEFSEDFSELSNIKEGDIIVTGITDETPYGLLRKVEQISHDNGKVILKTSTATLEEAIKKCEYSGNFKLSPSDVSNSKYFIKGISSIVSRDLKNAFRISFDNVVLYDADGNTSTTYDQIIVNGELDLTLEFTFDLKIEPSKLKKLGFYTVSYENIILTLDSKIPANFSRKIDIASFEFSPITFTIGPVPVVIVPEMVIRLDINSNTDARFEVGIQGNSKLKVGLQYSNGSWTPIKERSKEWSADYSPIFDFDDGTRADFRFSITPELNLKFYNASGLKESLSRYFEGSLDRNANPWFELYAGMKGDINTQTEIFSKSLSNFETKTNSRRKILELHPPNVPSNPNPKDNEQNVPTDTTLSWHCSDPDGDTLTYDIYFGTDPNPPLVKSDYTSSTYNPGQLHYSTTYYWKVVAKDGKGGVTESPVWKFTTQNSPNHPPNVPSNPNPKDNEQNVSTDTTLSWHCSDPDGDTLTYDIYFGTDPNPPLVKSDYTSSTYNPGQLHYSTTYYWKVVAKDGKGGVTESPVWKFTTQNSPNHPPNVPSNPNPKDNEQNVSTDTTLSWHCSDPDGDPLAFDVYFGKIDNPSLVATNIKDKSYDPGELEASTTYYWKVIAKDGKGGVTESPVWKFTTVIAISENEENYLQSPTIQWQKVFGGSNNDVARGIQQTSDGGYIVGGLSESNDGDVTGNHGDYDFWVVKLDSNGNIEWQKSLGGSGFDAVWGLRQTNDGGYIVAGETNSNDEEISGYHGGGDAWIVKLGGNGNIEWQRALGGSKRDIAHSVEISPDGGYLVVGCTGSNDGDVSGNHGDFDFWIVKLDSNGNIEWQRTIGGSEGDLAGSVDLTQDGGYIVAGVTMSNNGDVSGYHGGVFDFWVVKLDSNGNIEWQRALGGSGDEEAYSVQQTTDGGYIVVGETHSNDGDVSGNHGNGDIWVVKLDESGNVIWQKTLGGSGREWAESVSADNDGGCVIAGMTYSNDGDVSGNHGNGDIWVVKLDESGNVIWQKTLGGSEMDWPHEIQQTSDGGYVIAGWSSSNDGDVSGTHGGRDFWVIKLGR